MINKKLLLIILFISFPLKSFALIEIDITRGNLNPLPLAVSSLATTEKEIHIVADNGLSSANNRKLTIKLPRIAYDSNRLPTDNVERFVQAISFTCETNAAGDPIIVEVINAETEAQFTA